MSNELRYFCNTGDGIEYYLSAESAKERAHEVIDEMRNSTSREWPDEVELVCWGRVVARTVPVHLVGGQVDYKLEREE